MKLRWITVWSKAHVLKLILVPVSAFYSVEEFITELLVHILSQMNPLHIPVTCFITTYFDINSRVTRQLAGRPDQRGSTLGRWQAFIFSIATTPVRPPSVLSNTHRGGGGAHFPGDTRPGPETNHWHPSGSTTKNERCCISCSPYFFIQWCLIMRTLLQTGRSRVRYPMKWIFKFT
jgi:hypothetical protein